MSTINNEQEHFPTCQELFGENPPQSPFFRDFNYNMLDFSWGELSEENWAQYCLKIAYRACVAFLKLARDCSLPPESKSPVINVCQQFNPSGETYLTPVFTLLGCDLYRHLGWCIQSCTSLKGVLDYFNTGFDELLYYLIVFLRYGELRPIRDAWRAYRDRCIKDGDMQPPPECPDFTPFASDDRKRLYDRFLEECHKVCDRAKYSLENMSIESCMNAYEEAFHKETFPNESPHEQLRWLLYITEKLTKTCRQINQFGLLGNARFIQALDWMGELSPENISVSEGNALQKSWMHFCLDLAGLLRAMNIDSIGARELQSWLRSHHRLVTESEKAYRSYDISLLAELAELCRAAAEDIYDGTTPITNDFPDLCTKPKGDANDSAADASPALTKAHFDKCLDEQTRQIRKSIREATKVPKKVMKNYEENLAMTEHDNGRPKVKTRISGIRLEMIQVGCQLVDGGIDPVAAANAVVAYYEGRKDAYTKSSVFLTTLHRKYRDLKGYSISPEANQKLPQDAIFKRIDAFRRAHNIS